MRLAPRYFFSGPWDSRSSHKLRWIKCSHHLPTNREGIHAYEHTSSFVPREINALKYYAICMLLVLVELTLRISKNLDLSGLVHVI